MALRDIVAYVGHLRHNDLETRGFETAFWSRIARMTALILVLMLALPFALGPMRSSGQGARTVVGILIGAAYVLLSRTLESSGAALCVAALGGRLASDRRAGHVYGPAARAGTLDCETATRHRML